MVNPATVTLARRRTSVACCLVAAALAAVAVGSRAVGAPATFALLLLLAAGAMIAWSLWWFHTEDHPAAAVPCLVTTRTYAGIVTVVDIEPTGYAAAGSGRLRAVAAPVRGTLLSVAATAHAGPRKRLVVLTPTSAIVPLLPPRVLGRRPLDIGAAPDKPR